VVCVNELKDLNDLNDLNDLKNDEGGCKGESRRERKEIERERERREKKRTKRERNRDREMAQCRTFQVEEVPDPYLQAEQAVSRYEM